MHVAVYGTLKRGFGNNRLMDPRGFRFVGFFMSVDKLHMTSAGGFPVVYKDEPKHHIMVEVYEVTDKAYLSRVDNLEGHPTWYRREEREFTPCDPPPGYNGETVTAEVYMMSKSPSHPSYSNVRVTNNIAQWVRNHD